MLTAYRAHLLAAGRAAGTVRQRVAHLERLSLVHPDLAAVTTADLEAYLAERRFSHRAESRKAMRSSFRAFYAWTVRAGVLERDPALDLLPIRIPATVPRLAPDDAVQRALATATLEQRGMILLGRLACLRLTEIATLHTRHRERDALRVTGKGDKERLVYINDDLMSTLLELEQNHAGGFYFPGLTGAHLHPQSVNKIIVRLTGWNPHSLRHAGATAAYRATGDLRAVQEMLGHASMATTQRYLHVDEDARRAAAAGTSFRLHAAAVRAA